MLNRSLQDAALGRLAFWICVKAEEAGRRVWKVDPKNSSRTCAACGHTAGGNRHGTAFRCLACGHLAHADVNAAQVICVRGQIAETAWAAAGRPLLNRPKPRLRRHRIDTTTHSSGAGSAPHAVVA